MSVMAMVPVPVLPYIYVVFVPVEGYPTLRLLSAIKRFIFKTRHRQGNSRISSPNPEISAALVPRTPTQWVPKYVTFATDPQIPNPKSADRVLLGPSAFAGLRAGSIVFL